MLTGRTLTTGVVGLDLVALEVTIVILVRLTHDFICDAMLAAISDRFFFGHNTIVIRVTLLKIRHARRITGAPFFGSHLTVVIRVS